jgi:hypothetical protein
MAHHWLLLRYCLLSFAISAVFSLLNYLFKLLISSNALGIDLLVEIHVSLVKLKNMELFYVQLFYF